MNDKMIKPRNDGTIEDVLRRAVAHKRKMADEYDVVTLIALKLGKTPSAIYKLLAGEVEPSLLDVMALFDVCGYGEGYDELKAIQISRWVAR